jgi:DNA-binding response OmpR family regulator
MKKLKELTNDLSILYIEGDLSLQKRLGAYLNSLFKKVYQANDGIDGLEKFNKYKPDIIITDLELSKKDSFEMIVDIQSIDENAAIVVLSKKEENFELLESLDLGLIELLQKPLLVNKLNNALTKAINFRLKIDKCPICSELITKTIENKKAVRCVTNYKGIILDHHSEILSFEDNKLKIIVTKIQLISAIHQKKIIVAIDENYILAQLLEVDQKSNILTLIDPKIIKYHTRNSINKRIDVDQSFKTSISYKNKHMELKPINVSNEYISLLSEKSLDLKENDKVELTMGFDVNGPSSFINEKKFTKIFASAYITRIDNLNAIQEIIVKLTIQKSGQSTFKKYLQQREIDIINEFKMRMKL